MPTNTSIAGRVIDRAQLGATSDMKIASPIDAGAAIAAATTITPTVPRMNGKSPKTVGCASGDGLQVGERTCSSGTVVVVKSCTPFQPTNVSRKATSATTS